MGLNNLEISQLNKMNRASQNISLGTIIDNLTTGSFNGVFTGSFTGDVSGSATYAISAGTARTSACATYSNNFATTGTIASHINSTGSEIHGLGTISRQNSNSVNITGGSANFELTSINGSGSMTLIVENSTGSVARFGSAINNLILRMMEL